MHLTLVGAKFRPAPAREVLSSLSEGDEVFLRRDPGNPYDPNAIQIWAEEHFIGFVAKGEAAEIAQAMDDYSEANPDDTAVLDPGFSATVHAVPGALSIIVDFDESFLYPEADDSEDD